MKKVNIFCLFLVGAALISSTAMVRAEVSGPMVVDVWLKHRTFDGKTLLVDNNKGKVIEVDMDGRVVWDYRVPRAGFAQVRGGGFGAEDHHGPPGGMGGWLLWQQVIQLQIEPALT